MSEYTFDAWLREKRSKRGLTGEELALKAGTTKQTISSIERQAPHPLSGTPYRPTVKMVDKLAKALNESLAEARRAAGFASPRASVKREELEQDELLALYFRHNKLTGKRKAEFKRVLEMVDRELDRLELEEAQAAEQNAQNPDTAFGHRVQ